MKPLDSIDEDLQPRIIDMGTLSSATWPGSVKADHVSWDLYGSIRESLNDFYVPVDRHAKTRCIDGRHDPKLDEHNLGPQVPGGATGAALAYRLGVDKDDLTRGSFLKDGEAMIDAFLRLGFAPGGHRDAISGKERAGCGAIDGMDEILKCMTDPQLVEDHKRIVKNLLGHDFYRDDYLRVLGAALVLRSRSNDYFLNRKDILAYLEHKTPGSVSTLEGTHKEGLFVVNFVPGTTLSSNRFADAHEGMQAFGYDIWRSKQMAEAILPLPDQSIDRARYVMARVMLTIATMMALTDGSQHIFIRTLE